MVPEFALQRLVSGARRSGASMRAAWAGGIATPAVLVLLVALFQLAVWGGLSGALAVSAPDDSLEQVLLSQDLRLEYGKHPPLPTWILFASNRLFGASIGATYVLGSLCAIGTMLLLFVFARPLVGARPAALAAILLSNVEYLNAGSAYFNHNTVQLPLALLAIVLFHRALTGTRLRDWALFGVGCGVMMLAKFSAVVLFASFATYLVWSRRLGGLAVWKGVATAAAAAAAVFAPYYLAAQGDGSSPNAYAIKSIFPADVGRIECLKTVWGFASSQFAKVAPALLIFAALRRRAPAAPDPRGQGIALGPFLTIVGFGPMVLTVAVATLTGAHLLVGWGATFHVLLTFWLVTARPFAFDVSPSALRRAALASVGVQLGLWVLVTTHGGRVPNLNPTAHPVSSPMPVQLADVVRDVWAQHCAAPLRFVLSDRRTGAALAVRYQGAPRVVDATQADFERLFPNELRSTDGAMVVMRRPVVATVDSLPGPREANLADAAWRTTVVLPSGNGQAFKYDLGILRPLTGQGCEYAE